jgi:glycosyltransferase involved in cell wall biosynthesis
MKILFTHNTAMWYRLPFFKELSRIYELDLVFTHINVIEEIYDENLNKEIKGLEGVNYTILPNVHGFAKGLISKAKNSYDLTIGGSWDTPQELVETIVLYGITKIKKEPFIIWREDWDWDKEDNIKEKILQVIIKYLCKHSNAILVPGTLHKEYFKNKLDVPEKNIHIMPNVSNIQGHADLNMKNHHMKKILYVGRLIERKGVIYLLKAYEKLNLDNVELIIVGSGDEEEKLKGYVKEKNLKNVTFTGKINNEALEKYYNESNLVVVPSINKGMGDPWVFVLNEAMYYYNPIIATTAVGAAPDMISDNGFIVPEKDSDALKTAIETILNDKELENKMALKSKEIINNEFQYSNMINSFNECIKKVKK